MARMDVMTMDRGVFATAPRHLICSYSLAEPSHGEYRTLPEAPRRKVWTDPDFPSVMARLECRTLATSSVGQITQVVPSMF